MRSNPDCDPELPLLDDPSLPFNLNAEQAARFLGISKRTLWSITNAGEIPCQRIRGRVLYPRPALEKWVLDQTRPQRP
ncbi:MAG: helix-turn-helix domain-containing protein [Planctomycetota bacterium]